MMKAEVVPALLTIIAANQLRPADHPTNNLGAKPWVSWQVGGRGKISS